MQNNQENIRVKYQTCINLFIAESTNQWNRFSALLLINSILLSVLNTQTTNPLFQHSVFVKNGKLFGLLICVLWFISTVLGFKYKNKWIGYAKVLEKHLTSGLNPVTEGYRPRFRLIKVENVAYGIILLFTLFYLI